MSDGGLGSLVFVFFFSCSKQLLTRCLLPRPKAKSPRPKTTMSNENFFLALPHRNLLCFKSRSICFHLPRPQVLGPFTTYRDDNVGIRRPSVVQVVLRWRRRRIGVRVINAHDVDSIFSCVSFALQEFFRLNQESIALRLFLAGV